MPALENPKWEIFVKNLIVGKSQRQAYIAAYPRAKRWKDTTVDPKASNLFANAKVLARYQELQEQAQDAAIMTRKERMVTLSNLASNDGLNENARIKAIDTLNKMDGDYVDKVELSGQVQHKNPYADLTEEELRNLARGRDG